MEQVSLETDKLPRTRLAILRTMGPLHAEPLGYDLDCLREIILRVGPDLLCADITREDWENKALSNTALEVREALAPVIKMSDTVLVPVAPTPEQFSDYEAPPGWRRTLSGWFARLLQRGQRVANRPEAIHGVVFEAFCHTVCALSEMTWREADQSAYQMRNKALAENIVRAVQRDPGTRVLVVIQCQWNHTLEPILKREADWLEIVDYRVL
ncbi:MAG TPA: hypothetical protein VFZ76_03600 [Anaerolineales bacterium]